MTGMKLRFPLYAKILLWFFLNLYLQIVLNLSAFGSGLALLPMTLVIMVMMVRLTGPLIGRFGVKPVLVTVMVLTFLNTWNEYILPLYFLGSSDKWPMTLAVYNFFGMYFRDWNLVCADIVLTSLPVVIVYLLGQKYIVSGMTAGAVKG